MPGERNPNWTVDETILALELYLRRGRRNLDKGDPDVVDLSDVLNRLPIHGDRRGTFRNPTGVAMKISNIAAVDPDHPGGLPRTSKVDREVWDDFHDRPAELARLATVLRAGASGALQLPADHEEGEDEQAEGALLYRLHRSRERSPSLVRRKKEQTLERTGRLACEVCDFDFERTYGHLGSGYAECHHLVPLSHSGEVATRLADLAVLCANCHRMMHRSKRWLTVEDLSSRLRSPRD